jgi:hypothetical protein
MTFKTGIKMTLLCAAFAFAGCKTKKPKHDAGTGGSGAYDTGMGDSEQMGGSSPYDTGMSGISGKSKTKKPKPDAGTGGSGTYESGSGSDMP